MSKTVIIIGGHGHVALHLAKQISPKYKVISVIRALEQNEDISSTGATPVVLSLEEDSKETFTNLFEKHSAEIVVFSAGAGGKGGEERTKKVDYEGAVKIFEAIEGVNNENRPRLLLVSAVDIRDPEKMPSHYVGFFPEMKSSILMRLWQNEDDKVASERIRKVIPHYMHWKYEADKDLVNRTAFQWTILRPGGLNHNSGTGKVSLGITHITTTIPVCWLIFGFNMS
jgi:nucleoside-diphosphate-sugar epimerase